jgi:hypothetical protein
MQVGALDAKAGMGGEGGLSDMVIGGVRLEEADTVDGMAKDCGWVDAELGEGCKGDGQETFAAGFVDGRLHAVSYVDSEALKSNGNGASEAGRPCAHDEDVWLGRAQVHRKTSVLSLGRCTVEKKLALTRK